MKYVFLLLVLSCKTPVTPENVVGDAGGILGTCQHLQSIGCVSDVNKCAVGLANQADADLSPLDLVCAGKAQTSIQAAACAGISCGGG